MEQAVQAGFRIKRLLVEGHASETGSGWPPRGLQLLLGSPRHPDAADTLVMANLGYFQLPAATPGLWTLRIKRGRSAALYGFKPEPGMPAVGPTPAPADLARPVALASFRGSLVRPHFTKRPGREAEQILRDGGAGTDDDDLNDGLDDHDDVAAAAPRSMWASIKQAYGTHRRVGRLGSGSGPVRFMKWAGLVFMEVGWAGVYEVGWAGVYEVGWAGVGFMKWAGLG